MSKFGISRLGARGVQPQTLAQAMGCEYWRKVASIRPQNLIRYLPLWEWVTPNNYDYSGLGDHATGVGVDPITSNPEGAHFGLQFTGEPSHINLLSAEFTAHFNGAEGSLFLWGKAATAGQWTDGAFRFLVNIQVDANNLLDIFKHLNNTTVWMRLINQGVANQLFYVDINPGVAWFNLGLTWSKSANQFKGYYCGAQKGLTGTITNDFTGALMLALLGAQDNAAGNPWLGYLAHVALWNVPLNASEMKSLGEV